MSVNVEGATAAYLEARRELARTGEGPIPLRRKALNDLTDDWVTVLYAQAGVPTVAPGSALVAIGGYGRSELAPGSDLDLLLIHPPGASVTGVADKLWYPIWDSGIRLDHSVRTPAEARRLAAQDLKVLLGLIDARTIAGDDRLTTTVQSSVLADWRALAGDRLTELRGLVDERIARSGDLGHLLEPDLKESYGGLRDLTVLRAIAASWVTDIPREQSIADARQLLLDVRDGLHTVTGRSSDRLVLEEQAAVAEFVGSADEDALLRSVSAAARVVAFASDSTWYRVERLLRRRPSTRRALLRRAVRSRVGEDDDRRTPLAEGVVAHDGQVVLAAEARPDRDPVLALRAAAAAAQHGLPLAPHAVERLANESAPMPVPWPDEARDALVSLLGAGRAAVGVWESLDQAGFPVRWIPGWDVVRSAPQRNPVHRFTVDRHLVETAVAAADHLRRVSRPDLLLIGALLHDIGKARGEDHTAVGVRLVSAIGPQLGFDAADTATLVTLVRHHLLLPDMATRRDLSDPATVATVAAAVGDHATLDLLHALTEADASATGPAAWSEWKASLIQELVARTHGALRGDLPPSPPSLTESQRELAGADGVAVLVEQDTTGPLLTVTVAADDRIGLLATIAGVLSVHRLDVRAAETLTLDDAGPQRAVSVWRVQPSFGDPPPVERLREDVRRALDGSLDIADRLARRQEAYAGSRTSAVPAPRVSLVPGASGRATVFEVRAHDAHALLYGISMVLSREGADIVAARVSTLGSEVIDVFYLVGPDGRPLSEDRAVEVCAAVLSFLTPRSETGHPSHR